MADNLQKRPSKGILKNSSSFDTQESQAHHKKCKETKWDEMNIIATLHPADKDYGHMKIDEPKTPYNYESSESSTDQLDAGLVAEKLKSDDRPAKILDLGAGDTSDEEDEEEIELSPAEKEMRKLFEMKRKAHYNEYYAVKLARKLLEEEAEDDEDEDEENDSTPTTSSNPRDSVS